MTGATGRAGVGTRGVLVVDKPSGPTSHDVVRLARRAFGTRAVGHAGTLDPLASGVLILGIGEGTKLLNHMSGADKAYDAVVQLGAATDTLDSQGKVIERCAIPCGIEASQVRAAAERFLGETLQRAPEISAIKQAGEPLYARVRRGESVVAPERRVMVHSLVIARVDPDAIALHVHCGKGFYVRALARDLAEALGTLGHLRALRRTASGAFDLTDAQPLSLLTAAASGDAAARADLQQRLLSLTAAMRGFARVTATDEGALDIRHGRPLAAERTLEGALPPEGSEPVGVMDASGELIALGRTRDARLWVVRGLPAS